MVHLLAGSVEYEIKKKKIFFKYFNFSFSLAFLNVTIMFYETKKCASLPLWNLFK